ncbi:MAG TPA: hypothetical protein VK629_11890 [Steroidobacteraceae bacterium]|nr:hypothetical protein [Steroidobacteraceae bacterium]
MAAYQFRFLLSSKLIRTAEYYCFDDFDALNKAANLAERYEVQVWQGEKKVFNVVEGTARHNAHWPTAS